MLTLSVLTLKIIPCYMLCILIVSIWLPLFFTIDLNSNLSFNLFLWDNMSLCMMSLSLIFFVVMWTFFYYYNNDHALSNDFSPVINLLMLTVCFCFTVSNLLHFYILFELSLLPIFYIIINWGYQLERMTASFYILAYTLLFSLPFILFVLNSNHSFQDSYSFNISFKSWSYFILLPFIVNIPVYILHLWLPKAHLEAPTMGSMILAGILLNLGGYGLYRIYGSVLPFNNFLLLFLILVIWGCVLSCIFCVIQSDLNSIVAYSSVSHMGLIVLSVSSSSSINLKPIILIIISHAFCSSALFYAIGLVQENNNSRQLKLNRGINLSLSLSLFLFFFLICNFSMPPSMNFFAELYLIVNLFNTFLTLSYLFMFFLFLVSLYCVYLFTSVTIGNTVFGSQLDLLSTHNLVLFLHALPLISWFIVINLI